MTFLLGCSWILLIAAIIHADNVRQKDADRHRKEMHDQWDELIWYFDRYLVSACDKDEDEIEKFLSFYMRSKDREMRHLMTMTSDDAFLC